MVELEGLCADLQSKKYRSFQRCFDKHYEGIKVAVHDFGWDAVLMFINTHSDMDFKKHNIKTMHYRSKKNFPGDFKKNGGDTVSNAKKKAHQVTMLEKQTEGLSITESHSDEYQSYLTLCFNNARIADSAIKMKISVEELKDIISSQRIANDFQLRTYLSHREYSF